MTAAAGDDRETARLLVEAIHTLRLDFDAEMTRLFAIPGAFDRRMAIFEVILASQAARAERLPADARGGE